MSTPANRLTAELLIEIPKRFPGVRVWRANRIDAVAHNRDGSTRRIKAGIDGQADLSGIIGPDGRRLEIEIKVGKDRQSLKQRAFDQMIISLGGLYIIASTADECYGILEVATYS